MRLYPRNAAYLKKVRPVLERKNAPEFSLTGRFGDVWL
ncbi:MAG: hypothetical protein JWL62_1167, partial [Hyphomicrobiales bacterium]|nr:hypothetical protein [Hyphomicrobiales bacterium]